MKLYVARDANGELWIYDHKPIKIKSAFHTDINSEDCSAFQLPDWFLPEVTFENSPQEVELKLVKLCKYL